MENNRSKFVSHGYLINSTPEQLEIQISESSDAARYRSITHWSSRGTEVINGRWQEIINLSTCYSTSFSVIVITISVMAAETLSIAFGLTTSRNKSIKCESFTICCRLNLSGLQENKLMNTQ